jgi:hypothetical protein
MVPEDLAAYLDANLPDGINVYGYPPDVFAVPAVVIDPVDQVPYTAGGPLNVAWGLELKLVVSRTQPQYGLRSLYELRKQITDLFQDAPDSTRWSEFGDIGTVQVGDADYLQGTLVTVVIAAG